MINNKELIPLKRKIESVAEKVEKIDIKNADDLSNAVVILSQLNSYADSVKERKDLLTKPANEILKNARAMFKPLENIYEDAIELLRNKMSAYQGELVRIETEEKQRIAMRVKEGKGNLSVETAIKKITELGTVEKEIATSAGLVQFRETKVLKIIDASLIPREYLIIDESKLLKDLKEGKTVAGATTETKQIPVNYR